MRSAKLRALRSFGVSDRAARSARRARALHIPVRKVALVPPVSVPEETTFTLLPVTEEIKVKSEEEIPPVSVPEASTSEEIKVPSVQESKVMSATVVISIPVTGRSTRDALLRKNIARYMAMLKNEKMPDDPDERNAVIVATGRHCLVDDDPEHYNPREYKFACHPDRGGDLNTFQAINDAIYRIQMQDERDKIEEEEKKARKRARVK